MHFPVYIHLGRWTLTTHPVFESLAYFVGARIYFFRRKTQGIPTEKGLWIVVGAVLGAALGSKLLSWLEDPWVLVQHLSDPHYWMGGQTIVGALLGGLIGVEWAKKRMGVKESTGDDFVLPLMIGMCIGRIGCFLAGLPDHTYGTPTHWFTGVDFGDGIPRHPTQLYEFAWLIILYAIVGVVSYRDRGIRRQWRSTEDSPPHLLPPGARFQIFMFGYLVFRLVIEFIKPTPHPYFGLSNIQIASLAGVVYYAFKMGSWSRNHSTAAAEVEHA